MPNFSVNQGNIHPLPPVNPPEPNQLKPQTEEQHPPLSESQRREVFQEHQQLSGPKDNPIGEENIQKLTQSVDQSNSQSLNENTQTVPNPQQLDQVRLQIPRAQTLTIQPLQLSDLHLDKPEFRQARKVFNHNSVNQIGGQRNEIIKDFFREELKPFLKEMSKIDNNLLLSPQAKQEALTQVREKAHARIVELMGNYGTKDEISVLMKMNSVAQNKALIAELVGEIRDGKSTSFEQLSEKKQKFVNAIMKAFKDVEKGFPDAHPPIPKMQEGRKHPVTPYIGSLIELQTQFKSQLQTLNPSQLHQLKAKSDQQLQEFLAQEFGHSDIIYPILIEVIRTTSSPETPRTVEPYVRPLNPQDLQVGGIPVALNALTTAPGSEQAREQLRTALQTHLAGLDPKHNTLWQLGLMNQQELKQFAQQMGLVNEQDQNWMVSTIRSLLPNQSSQETRQLDGFTVPSQMVINGKTYVAGSYLTTAGFGHIFIYENSEDSSDRVVVKMAKEDPTKSRESQHQEVIKELNLHRELQGSEGHQNIIGLLGAVYAPPQQDGSDGPLLIVQEYASGGTLYDFSKQLQKVTEVQVISEENKQFIGLALLKQSLESLSYMHDEREMLHSDLKSPNLMLGTDGQLKMIDFGTSSLGTNRTLVEKIVDNTDFLAPEQIAKGTTLASPKSDVWGLGILAYQLLIGSNHQHGFYNFETEYKKSIALLNFTQDPQARFMDYAPGVQGRELSPKEQQIHELLNGLLNPIPEQRLSAREALQHPLFQDERLSSPQTQEMLKKLALPLPSGLNDEQKSIHRFSRVRDDLMVLGMSVPQLQ